MMIETQQDVDAVNGKFNHFHDGFIKQVRVTSENEFLTDMPWENQRQFASNEEELRAAGLSLLNTTTVELHIHHYNYDWPNQSRKRLIIVRADSAQLSKHLLSFTGGDIFDLAFTKNSDGVSCILTYHENDAGPTRNMENGITTVLFSAEKMEIEETEWAEQNIEGDVLKSAP